MFRSGCGSPEFWMCAAGKVLCVASAHSNSCSVGPNSVWSYKCTYLRAFNRRCLIKHSNKFDLTTWSPSRATLITLTKWRGIAWHNVLKILLIWSDISVLYLCSWRYCRSVHRGRLWQLKVGGNTEFVDLVKYLVETEIL